MLAQEYSLVSALAYESGGLVAGCLLPTECSGRAHECKQGLCKDAGTVGGREEMLPVEVQEWVRWAGRSVVT